MGNKGFFLIETLIVTTIVAVAMVALYTQTSKILDAFEMRTTYNSPNNMYAIAEINRYIIKDSKYVTFSTNAAITVNGFYPITCNLFSNSTYCTNLYTDLDIAKVIVTKYNTLDIKTKAPTEVTFSEGLKTFISNIKNVTTAPATKYRLIIEFNDQTYATIEFDAGIDTQIPTISGTTTLYYMTGEVVNVKEGLTASDNLYNDITDSIVCNFLSGSTYRCVATDSNGNVSANFDRVVTAAAPVTTYSYTGALQIYTVPVAGYYQIELWGGQGTTRNAGTNVGGLGAYAIGIRYFNYNAVINLYVGGTGSNHTGGYNGGGNGGGTTIINTAGGGGGGATDARFGGTGVANRFLVAAGGAGSSGYTAGFPSSGGYGGGATNGGNGTYTTATYNGSGATVTLVGAVCSFNVLGTPTAGNTSGVGGNGGSISTSVGAGGGGGGYYGGGGGCDRYGSGGGGSSYASSDVTAVQLIAGNAIMPGKFTGTTTGSAGAGAARITFISR